LPVIPPLALLLARAVDDDQRASRRTLSIQTGVIFLGVVAMLLFDRRRDGVIDPPVYWACGVSVTAIIVAWSLRWWRQPATQHAAWMPVALAAMFAWQGLLAAYAILPPERSSRALVRDIGAEIRPATRLYSVRQYRHSLSFYLGRTLILVDYKGELEEGLRRVGETTPPRYIDDLRSFVEAWNADRDAVAFIEPGVLAELQTLGFSGRRLTSDDPRSVVMARQ
jgi:Aminoarabinose transferase C-terminal domain